MPTFVLVPDAWLVMASGSTATAGARIRRDTGHAAPSVPRQPADELRLAGAVDALAGELVARGSSEVVLGSGKAGAAIP
ncbi:hypothetical protein [Amycolatopsis pithecellobii]|uniref:Uncharacterized protein n=1 Tax=Amycolatopsis pithecellobii TaxID=664692 RepID=A0A6N7Z5B2_9PSEU|nr:hypothetical protein [Amycolatopsis pithecellobii]MTD57433.1 hypothetical protein [Amycolatopsis pithecellobii]